MTNIMNVQVHVYSFVLNHYIISLFFLKLTFEEYKLRFSMNMFMSAYFIVLLVSNSCEL